MKKLLMTSFIALLAVSVQASETNCNAATANGMKESKEKASCKIQESPQTKKKETKKKLTLKERTKQWEDEMRQMREEKKKEEKEYDILDSISWNQATKAIEDRKFVLEGDRVIFKHGETVNVDGQRTFVLLDSDRGVVQVSPSNFAPGANGVGGITADGLVSSVKTETDKKGNLTLTMYINGRAISAQVDITLYKGTNRATAVVSPTFNSNRTTIEGKIVPAEYSNYFEGISL